MTITAFLSRLIIHSAFSKLRVARDVTRTSHKKGLLTVLHSEWERRVCCISQRNHLPQNSVRLQTLFVVFLLLLKVGPFPATPKVSAGAIIPQSCHPAPPSLKQRRGVLSLAIDTSLHFHKPADRRRSAGRSKRAERGSIDSDGSSALPAQRPMLLSSPR